MLLSLATGDFVEDLTFNGFTLTCPHCGTTETYYSCFIQNWWCTHCGVEFSRPNSEQDDVNKLLAFLQNNQIDEVRSLGYSEEQIIAWQEMIKEMHNGN